jgi:predicted RNA-binding protein
MRSIVKVTGSRSEDQAQVAFCFGGEVEMCEAKVYLGDGAEETEIIEDVVTVQPEGDAWLLINLLGEHKLVRGTLRRIDFLKHTVHLQRPAAAGCQ